MKFYHPITKEEIISPVYRMQAFKTAMMIKYGEGYRGSALSEEELDALEEIKIALAKETADFIANPCVNARNTN